MKRMLTIKSTVVSIVSCVILTFGAALLMLSEWYYKEERLSPDAFKTLSILIFIAYAVSFRSLAVNTFDQERNRMRKGTVKVGLMFFFVLQSIFSIEVLGLLFITLGIW